MLNRPGTTPRQRVHDALLQQHLLAIFGTLPHTTSQLLLQHLQWMEVAGGETLLVQGEAGDSMYIVVSGRLRAYIHAADGSERMVGEMARGHSVGELSLYTDEPRAATVVAVRDSVLVRLDKPAFRAVLESSAQVSIALTRQIVHRLKGDGGGHGARHGQERPVVIGLVPVSTGVAAQALATELAAQLAARLGNGAHAGRVRLVMRTDIEALLQEEGFTADDPDTRAAAQRRVAMLLDEIEAAHDAVLLLADTEPSAWTQRCCRHCDELVLLADATQPPALHPTEQLLVARGARAEVNEVLVLLHPAGTLAPRGTAAWLARRPVAGHVHIRPSLERDMARLARLLSRTAVGLVLAGGGARGFAHLGAYRALRERGVEIDWVGGTSIGAVMAAYVASDQPLPKIMDNARRAFAVNPTGDFNLFPLVSLFKGLRLRGVLQRAVQELVGFDADIEDLWKNYYCVATSYSQARERRIECGNLVRALLASISIPGALPPVIQQGELLCDGGIFNNFPVDQMRAMRGVGCVVGVDLNTRTAQRIEHDDMPGTLALWRDRLRPAAQRRYRLPLLPTYLMTVTGLYSASRNTQSRALCDLYLHPALDRVGMLQWQRADQIVERGYRHAEQVMAKADPALSALLGARQPE